MTESHRLHSPRALATYARAMAGAHPRHVGVLLLDSAAHLISYMLFPAPPDPPTLLAGLYASRTARVAVCIVRDGPTPPQPQDRVMAMHLLSGARFLGLPIDVLVVTPDGHEAIHRSRESQSMAVTKNRLGRLSRYRAPREVHASARKEIEKSLRDEPTRHRPST